jgi:hypothetical protein
LCLVSFLLFVFGGGPLYLKGLIVFAFLCFALATMYRNLRRVAFIKEKRIVKRREL